MIWTVRVSLNGEEWHDFSPCWPFSLNSPSFLLSTRYSRDDRVRSASPESVSRSAVNMWSERPPRICTSSTVFSRRLWMKFTNKTRSWSFCRWAAFEKEAVPNLPLSRKASALFCLINPVSCVSLCLWSSDAVSALKQLYRDTFQQFLLQISSLRHTCAPNIWLMFPWKTFSFLNMWKCFFLVVWTLREHSVVDDSSDMNVLWTNSYTWKMLDSFRNKTFHKTF